MIIGFSDVHKELLAFKKSSILMIDCIFCFGFRIPKLSSKDINRFFKYLTTFSNPCPRKFLSFKFSRKIRCSILIVVVEEGAERPDDYPDRLPIVREPCPRVSGREISVPTPDPCHRLLLQPIWLSLAVQYQSSDFLYQKSAM